MSGGRSSPPTRGGEGLGGELSAVLRRSGVRGLQPWPSLLARRGNGPPDRFLFRLEKWFQSETGLHQNWMRDYDPTTGGYMQADPLGLIDGASVYGYALQNPGRYVDPKGEQVSAW
ncbi:MULTISPECIES: RHS repeat-associated core domain-containing protein [unclassified Yoonia]|uniref:RHS repeat-associated core domain-containing protein n=1 Tax=unclassified Yoonia TaxID=2629118 RepID=UPI002AFF997A|nr:MULTISPECIES: RHS repeat-associated core domain-containing protein [unclassified Yoonia]